MTLQFATPLTCEQWESLLAEAVDGTLDPAIQARFDEHATLCATCAKLLTETRRGHQWLHMLETSPEPPADLLHRILVATSGDLPLTPAMAGANGISIQPVWRRVNLVAIARRSFEPRLWMTAAMAFFSIALTLNLSGVQISRLRWSDLRPSALRSNIERQVYAASNPVVRYYDHLRIVYEVESKVRQYRQSEEEKKPSPNNQSPQAQPSPSQQPGSADQRPGTNGPSKLVPPREFVSGERTEASVCTGSRCALEGNERNSDPANKAASKALLPTRTSQDEERSWA
jgi:hypothetical protein